MIILILKLLIPCLNIIYFFFKLLPTQDKVVMISRQSNNINNDFKLLGKKLEKKHQVVYLCKTLDGKAHSSNLTRISYGFHMFRQMYHLATAKVCILDSYCPTVSLLHHKKRLTIIQMWHSIGTMKKFGYAVLDKAEGSDRKLTEVMRMHKNYDIIFASSKAYRAHLASGFNYPEEKIMIYTLPRIDLLTDKKYAEKMQKKIYKKYPKLQEKPNVLYCPTFRQDETRFQQALEDLIASFDFNKYNLIVKLHPLAKSKVSNEQVIYAPEFSTFAMLFVSDKCISDYSCVIYEAGIRNIPLYFYDFDIDEYQVNRGLALDYTELPGYTSPHAKDIVAALNKEYDYKYLKKFIKKYVSNTQNCTDKIVKKVEEFM